MKESKVKYRREGKKVYIKNPEFHELEYTQKLWSDFDSMEDVGRVISFPKEDWDKFYNKMVNPTDGKNFYCLVYNYDNVPVGEVSFHGYDSATKTARLNVRIQNMYRGLGYGREATKLLLEYFFCEFMGSYIVDTVNNNIAKKALESLGFKNIFTDKKKVATYRLCRDEFFDNISLSQRKIALVAYDGIDCLNVNLALSIFDMLNKILGQDLFEVEIISNKREEAFLFSNIKFNVDKSFKDEIKYDIIIFPETKLGNNIALDKEFLEFVKKSFKNCELVIAIGEGILPLLKSGVLKGLKIKIPHKYMKHEEYIDLLTDVYISQSNIIDNGRVFILNGFNGTIKGYLYLAQKMCGEAAYKKLYQYFFEE
ncbi:GNAT family N-acetyltransferase [Clostridium tarantellae]|uniref:GNAT family N-acetyltransferase n=1 Tax=Clostridium tarantellae TaxID=39493 RepID=A0A6I1MPX4_9CLOT|nr:GNAT family N-acetyltransferase [Clostridium tarantellae]MPQ45114.1 GNAT family N-acetyltransferase [Clostridium tarantellae]